MERMNPENLVGRPDRRSGKSTGFDRIRAVSDGGRRSALLISGTSDGSIGEGMYGEIRRVSGDIVSGSGEDMRHRPFGSLIVKDFRLDDPNDREERDWTEQHIRDSVRIHAVLRELGVDTWRTFRRIEGKFSVIMSDGEENGSLTISRNDSKSKERISGKYLDGIEDFGEVISSALDGIRKASNGGVDMPKDCWFANVRVEKTDAARPGEEIVRLVRIYAGDLDAVRIDYSDDKERYRRNLEGLLRFTEEEVVDFLVVPERREVYRDIMADIARSASGDGYEIFFDGRIWNVSIVTEKESIG